MTFKHTRSSVVRSTVLAVALAMSAAAAGSAQGPESTAETVGFLAGHGERTPTDGMGVVAAALGARYAVSETDLSEGDALDGLSVLVVAAPLHVPDAELFEIDQFLMKGGSVLFLLNGASVGPDYVNTVSPGNVFSYVSRYGAVVAADLVVDPVSADSLSMLDETSRRKYPDIAVAQLWPAVSRPTLSPAHPANAGVNTVVFPWASSISLVRKNLAGVRVARLANSSPGSWTVVADEAVGDVPFKRPVPGAPGVPWNVLRERMLAVTIEGEFASAFLGSPVLIEEGGRPRLTEPPDRIDMGVESRIAVVGCSRVFEDEFVALFPENADYFVDIVDWLAGGDAGERTDGEDETSVAAFIGAGAALLAGLVAVLRRRKTAGA